ncbi:hypothetical protein BT63DRAFT_450463 [Microthyrium microscopicum]|uniref:Uncharacterized protein n=1 Tax=Microthyrium microscopicum TaxID=703497 RepID=A0A6A6UT93_9PEZI|nr:hypothetical protein BT63DRAFT_450463 [Microthyrium microscopicum]
MKLPADLPKAALDSITTLPFITSAFSVPKSTVVSASTLSTAILPRQAAAWTSTSSPMISKKSDNNLIRRQVPPPTPIYSTYPAYDGYKSQANPVANEYIPWSGAPSEYQATPTPGRPSDQYGGGPQPTFAARDAQERPYIVTITVPQNNTAVPTPSQAQYKPSYVPQQYKPPPPNPPPSMVTLAPRCYPPQIMTVTAIVTRTSTVYKDYQEYDVVARPVVVTKYQTVTVDCNACTQAAANGMHTMIDGEYYQGGSCTNPTKNAWHSNDNWNYPPAQPPQPPQRPPQACWQGNQTDCHPPYSSPKPPHPHNQPGPRWKPSGSQRPHNNTGRPPVYHPQNYRCNEYNGECGGSSPNPNQNDRPRYKSPGQSPEDQIWYPGYEESERPRPAPERPWDGNHGRPHPHHRPKDAWLYDEGPANLPPLTQLPPGHVPNHGQDWVPPRTKQTGPPTPIERNHDGWYDRPPPPGSPLLAPGPMYLQVEGTGPGRAALDYPQPTGCRSNNAVEPYSQQWSVAAAQQPDDPEHECHTFIRSPQSADHQEVWPPGRPHSPYQPPPRPEPQGPPYQLPNGFVQTGKPVYVNHNGARYVEVEGWYLDNNGNQPPSNGNPPQPHRFPQPGHQPEHHHPPCHGPECQPQHFPPGPPYSPGRPPFPPYPRPELPPPPPPYHPQPHPEPYSNPPDYHCPSCNSHDSPPHHPPTGPDYKCTNCHSPPPPRPYKPPYPPPRYPGPPGHGPLPPPYPPRPSNYRSPSPPPRQSCALAHGRRIRGFLVQCDEDEVPYSGAGAGTLVVVTNVERFDGCLDECVRTRGCVGVAWTPDSMGARRRGDSPTLDLNSPLYTINYMSRANVHIKLSAMGFPVVRIAKFVGTISLGLLTGISYSLSTITFPALLHLPTAPLAAQTNTYVRTAARTLQRQLSTICTGAFIFALLCSPRRLRHPYLLYTALVCQLGASTRVVDNAARKLYPAAFSTTDTKSRAEELAESAVLVGQGSSSSENEEEEDVNGEVVRREVEKAQAQEKIRFGVWGFGFVVGVIGIWGDML